MATQKFVDTKVAYGYAKAASKVGSVCTVYRPATAFAPLQSTPLNTTLMAAFDAKPSLTFTQSIPWDGPIVQGMFDPTGLKVGDMITNQAQSVSADAQTSVYFIIRHDPYRPNICALTTNIAQIYDTSQPAQDVQFGSRPPSGPSKAQDVLIASDWPVAVVMSARGSAAQAKLPTDTRRPTLKLLLPAVPGVVFKGGIRVILDTGMYLRVEGAHLSQFGWHLECVEDSV